VNPLAWLMILIGVLLAVVGFGNRQDNLLSAMTGKLVGSSTLK